MKILAIQLNRPGDAILTTPALRWWINTGYQVHVLVQPASAQLLDTMPGLAGVHPLERETLQLGRDIRRWRQFSKIGFDWAVVFSHSSERPSLWAFLSGARKRTAIILRKYPHFLRETGWITQWMRHPTWAHHVVEEHLALAGALSGEAEQYDLEYTPSNEARQWHAGWMERHGLQRGKYIHYHLTARLPEKTWPVHHARKFLHLLRQFTRVIVTTGPDGFEKNYGYDVIHGHPGVVSEIGTLSPHQLGAIIEGTGAFVGMDSMPMHLAAAMKIPGVALFGPTDCTKWGPWHSPLTIISSGKPATDMESISPERVFQALQEKMEHRSINETGRQPSSHFGSFTQTHNNPEMPLNGASAKGRK